jgi:hypothetical protein
MVFLALKTFNLVFKVGCTDFGTRSKVLLMENDALKTFNLVKMFYKNFNLVPKNDKNYQSFQSSVKTHF